METSGRQGSATGYAREDSAQKYEYFGSDRQEMLGRLVYIMPTCRLGRIMKEDVNGMVDVLIATKNAKTIKKFHVTEVIDM